MSMPESGAHLNAIEAVFPPFHWVLWKDIVTADMIITVTYFGFQLLGSSPY
jgi:hypothetical protein